MDVARLAKARETANLVTSNIISSRVKADPNADLSDLLKQSSSTYPRLVDDLARAASKDSTSSNKKTDVSSSEDSQIISTDEPI
ncbi:hypothetical protein CFIMG_004425RAa [Ceratocystis fimbriata CBS 114723]|uniref:Uncharacterized protein n=1 Tax=Ceratocystis fimbriata CBS 114723 TaxID=1035309 RepID=A0A2C5WYW0_9PEZI|nr:hypothetical protein CFIMG_004425RAa [Ceratocystis fimbriata CBS 114723]